MLYNESWTKPRNEIYSIPGLIAWLEKQPANYVYDYTDYNSCATAQYLRTCGERHVGLLTSELEQFNWHQIVAPRPWSYGAALERARKVLGAA